MPPALCLAVAAALASSAAPAPSISRPASVTAVEGTVEIAGMGAAADVVVHLIPTDGASPVIGRDLLDVPYRIDQRGLRFNPHVLAVPVGATVEFANSDRVLHNIFVPPLDTEGFDLGTWPQGETRRHTFAESGVYVILCSVHPDMEAFVVVVPTPYFARTGEDGSFTIENVPPGAYTLHAWHERGLAQERQVEVGGQTVQLSIALRMRLPE